VRAPAEIDPVALPVERDRLLLGNGGDDLGLVLLAHVAEELHRFVARHLAARDRQVALRNLGHAPLDRGEVFGRKGALVGKIVIEAVFDHRADGDLRIGEELLHRVREQVRRRVAQQVVRFRVLVGDDGDVGIARDAVAGVDQLAVHFAGERGTGKPRADRGGDLGYGKGSGKRLRRAVGQTDVRHCCD